MSKPLAFKETERTSGSATKGGKRKIRCPKCAWEPRKRDRWGCTCGHTWNTFETGGICPACDTKWTETQCLRCHVWSAHERWYVDE